MQCSIKEASQEEMIKELKTRSDLKREVRSQMFVPSESFILNSDALCTLKDYDSRFLAMSPRLAMHFGIKNDQVVGKTLAELFGTSTTNRSDKHDEYVVRCRDAFFGAEWWFNGKYGWWEGGVVHKQPIISTEGEIRVYSIIPSALMKSGFDSEEEVKQWLLDEGHNL